MDEGGSDGGLLKRMFFMSSTSHRLGNREFQLSLVGVFQFSQGQFGLLSAQLTTQCLKTLCSHYLVSVESFDRVAFRKNVGWGNLWPAQGLSRSRRMCLPCFSTVRRMEAAICCGGC